MKDTAQEEGIPTKHDADFVVESQSKETVEDEDKNDTLWNWEDEESEEALDEILIISLIFKNFGPWVLSIAGERQKL